MTVLQDEVAVAYAGLGYDQAELAGVMRRTYDEILAFITTPEFTEVLAEMGTLGAARRPSFVAEVLLDPEELQQRGVVAPPGILIQRSAFGDRRPTLFVVKKFLPDKYRNVWQNVNITFDNEYEDHEVTRDAQLCWRPPLDPDDQARAMAEGRDLAAL